MSFLPFVVFHLPMPRQILVKLKTVPVGFCMFSQCCWDFNKVLKVEKYE